MTSLPHTHTHTDSHTHRHTQTHTDTHRHTQTDTHTHTHTHTHRHTDTDTDRHTRETKKNKKKGKALVDRDSHRVAEAQTAYRQTTAQAPLVLFPEQHLPNPNHRLRYRSLHPNRHLHPNKRIGIVLAHVIIVLFLFFWASHCVCWCVLGGRVMRMVGKARRKMEVGGIGVS